MFKNHIIITRFRNMYTERDFVLINITIAFRSISHEVLEKNIILKQVLNKYLYETYYRAGFCQTSKRAITTRNTINDEPIFKNC